MSPPAFSVLLPSKDRPDLLLRAIDSVRRQEFADFEVIVSDNASILPYADAIAGIGDSRIRLVRGETSVPVTQNWNIALAQVTGDYVVMLGDDDALAPGYFEGLSRIIKQFRQPEVIYSSAYHYMYPGVSPTEPAGYFAIVRNSPLFIDRFEPYRLRHAEAVSLAKKALNFHHYFSFNSQHFLWKRSTMASISRGGDFFKSPYPDFYSAIMTFLNSEDIVVQPLPQIIIGISPRSFGYYYQNNQQAAGHAFLGDRGADADALPGSEHNTKWLMAARAVEASMGSGAGLSVGVGNYRQLQMVEALRNKATKADPSALDELANHLRPHERGELALAALGLRALRWRRPTSQGTTLFRFADRALDQHFQGTVTRLPLEGHTTILDALSWLEGGAVADSADAGNPFLSHEQNNVLNRFHDLYYSLMAEGAGVKTIGLTWLGHELFKCPMDLWLYQELIAAQRPDVVIETGTYRGGSAHFLATLCDLVGHGKVVSVDINAWADMPRPQHPRLSYLVGSSTDPAILSQLHVAVGKSRNVLVILDSDHTRQHVLDELRLYQQFVPVGGFLIVEDTNVNGHPTYPTHGPGPWEAIDTFLAENPNFIADRSLERFLLTMNPRGYLKRIGPS